MYSDIQYPELVRGMKTWKNPKNGFTVAMLHYTCDDDKDPSRNGKEWYANERKGALKSLWNKEMEIDFSTKSGKLIFGSEYCDFDPSIHFINSFEFDVPVEQLISLDFGQRNPTAALIGIWTAENVLYIVDEYYKPAIPSVSSREMFTQFEYLMHPNTLEEKTLSQKRSIAIGSFSVRVIDPTTKAKNRTKVIEGEEIPYSILEEFYDNGWEFELAANDVDAGITRIREYLQLDSNNKAHLYIFKDKCPNLCREIQHWRYKEHTEVQEKTRNDSESPVKKDDHAVDALRYMIMTRPNKPQIKEQQKTRIQKDIENLLRPRNTMANFDNDGFIN